LDGTSHLFIMRSWRVIFGKSGGERFGRLGMGLEWGTSTFSDRGAFDRELVLGKSGAGLGAHRGGQDEGTGQGQFWPQEPCETA